ncbi:MAG: hypothetical protein LBG19_12920 [Prevotellaceae bacterium]|jgi:hypothetical protein|nr:hypothetical protein [Prevotellaceae bacterium]
MNRMLIGLLLCFGYFPLLGQVEIEGTLFSSGGGSLSGVSIIIRPLKDAESIITYGFSDNNGRFKISVKHGGDSIALSIKSMLYADTLLRLANRSQALSIPLEPQSHLLEEAKIRASPIYRKGDTTVYSVQAFARKQDFSIGDVIKKMPGFDVDESGKISFQGQHIEKYYIEGLDLLESRYALANNNLPHTSVGSVEVLHDHQPIKAVDGIISSSSTSLNIKLKSSVAVTGRAQVGAGFSPLLWDVNLTPMLFAKGRQVIASWQTNNVGNDLSTQHRTLTFSNGKLDGAATLKSNLVEIPNLSQLSIARNKYLDNEANLATYNHLVKLSSTTELKISGSYYHDNIAEEGYVATSYFLQDSVLNIYERQRNTLFRGSLIANLSLTQNVKSRYLLNKVSFGRFWDTDNAEITGGTNQAIKAKLPHTTIANTLDVLIPIKKNFLRVESVVDYNDSPQTLDFLPGVFITGNELEQQVSNRSFITTNKLSFSLPVKSLLFSTVLGVDHEHQKYETAVVVDGILSTADSLSNALKWSKWDAFVRENVEYKKGKILFRLGLPLQYTMLSIIDNRHSASDEMNRWFFKPSAFIQYKPTGSIAWNLFASQSKALGNMNNLLMGNVIVNHRQTRSNQADIDVVKSTNLRTEFVYKNLAKGLFASISWNMSNTKRGLMLNQVPQGGGLFAYRYERRDNDTKINNLLSEFSRYISGFKTTLGIKGEYSKNCFDYLLSGQLEEMNQQVFAVTPNFLFGFSKYFSVGYSYRLAKTKTDIVSSSSNFLNQKHKLDFYLYITSSDLIGFENELYHTKKTGLSTSQSLFSNVVYSFKPVNSRVSLKLECRNLFDTNKLSEIRQSDIVLLYTEYYLRPRQFILTATWSLGMRKK